MRTKRNIIKVLLALICYASLPSVSLFAQTDKRTQALRQSVPWNPEGQTFDSYDQFKDDFIFALRTSIKRIIVASMYISDNDIMAALYSARARGIKVTVLVDKYANTGTRARLRPRFPHVVYTDLDAVNMEGDSTLVIDRSVWRLSTSLDVNTEDTVRIDRSPYTAPEIEGWIKQGAPAKPPETRPDRGANPSTSDTQPKLRIFGNIKKTNEPVVQGAVPRKLPRETKWQKLNRGVDTELLNGDAPGVKTPAAVPNASSRESDLTD